MKKSLQALRLTCVLPTGSAVCAETLKNDRNKSVSPAASKLVADAIDTAKRDRAPEAIAAL